MIFVYPPRFSRRLVTGINFSKYLPNLSTLWCIGYNRSGFRSQPLKTVRALLLQFLLGEPLAKEELEARDL